MGMFRVNIRMCAQSAVLSVMLTMLITINDPDILSTLDSDCHKDLHAANTPRIISRRGTNYSDGHYEFLIPEYEFNCTNIHEIELDKPLKPLGHGVSKKTYAGTHKGRRVAVKMATMEELYSKKCIDDGLDQSRPEHICYRLSNMKLMKEILFVQQLRHPSIMKLLGFCLRSEEMKEPSLAEHGLLAVYEFAEPLLPSHMKVWPLKKRLEKAVELFDAFDYLEHSPIGSIQFPDLKLAHFLWADNRIKLHDFDDANIKEPICTDECGQYGGECVNNQCLGYAAKMNRWKLNFEFSRYFFPETFHKDVPMLKEIADIFNTNRHTAYDIGSKVSDLLDLLPSIEAKTGPLIREQYLWFIKPDRQPNAVPLQSDLDNPKMVH